MNQELFKDYLETIWPEVLIHQDSEASVRARDELAEAMKTAYERYRWMGLSENRAIRRVLSDYSDRLNVTTFSSNGAVEQDQAIHQFFVSYATFAHKMGVGILLSVLSILPMLFSSYWIATTLGHRWAVIIGFALTMAILGYGLWILVKNNRQFDQGIPIEHMAMHLTPTSRQWIQERAIMRRRLWATLILVSLIGFLISATLGWHIYHGTRILEHVPLVFQYAVTAIILSIVLYAFVRVFVELSAFGRLVRREERLSGRNTYFITSFRYLFNRPRRPQGVQHTERSHHD